MNVLYELVHAWQKAEMFSTSIDLGLYGLLAQGPLTAKDLAQKANLNEDKVFRLLRASAGEGLVDYDRASNTFSLNNMSKLFAGENSLLPVAKLLLGPGGKKAWHALPSSLKDDSIPFEVAHKLPIFEFMKQNPRMAEVFHQAMSVMNRNPEFAKQITQAYPFAEHKKIVDVAGGDGLTLANILRNCPPTTTGVVHDYKHVFPVEKLLELYPDLAGRITFEESDFFQSVPAGGDLYYLKNILHDWDDAKCIQILQTIHKQVPPKGKVVSIEFMISDHKFATNYDMSMMVMTGGQERTEQELKALFDSAGFDLLSTRKIQGFPNVVVEAQRR